MPADQQQVAAALQQQVAADQQQGPRLLASCGLSPELLPGLVEHNPGIAVEAVLQLLTTPAVQHPSPDCLEQGMANRHEGCIARLHEL